MKTIPRTFDALSRRQIISGFAASAAALATIPCMQAQQDLSQQNISQQNMAKLPGNDANKKLTSLHQEVSYKATPQKIYEVLLDSKQFTAFTGAPAEINRETGGAFSLFGGLIVGRNIELVANQRIVQAWRPADWPSGLYSLVRFELQEHSPETTVTLDQSSFPEGEYDHLSAGWKSHYWDPLRKFLA